MRLIFLILLILLFLVILLIVLGLELLPLETRPLKLLPSWDLPFKSQFKSEILSKQFKFAEKLGYQIENLSTLTYTDLGKMGRLGNQLFEIAATIAVAKENRCLVLFPDYILKMPLAEIIDLSDFPLSSNLKPELRIPEYSNYDKIRIPNDARVYNLEGYRQSISYLKPIWKELRKIFPIRESFRPGISQTTRVSQKRGLKQIALHLRRTDCIKSNPILNFFDQPLNCSLEYYKKALQRFPKDYPILIVTDDRDWAEAHLKEFGPRAKLTQSGNLSEDFLTLINSEYLIIANSTFSLWAALLGQASKKPGRVVGPSYWFHPKNKIASLLGSRWQIFCPSDWIFHNPITGEPVERSYDWEEVFEDRPNYSGISTQVLRGAQRLIRSVLNSNRFRF